MSNKHFSQPYLVGRPSIAVCLTLAGNKWDQSTRCIQLNSSSGPDHMHNRTQSCTIGDIFQSSSLQPVAAVLMISSSTAVAGSQPWRPLACWQSPPAAVCQDYQQPTAVLIVRSARAENVMAVKSRGYLIHCRTSTLAAMQVAPSLQSHNNVSLMAVPVSSLAN